YRLNVVTLQVPSLREHLEDVPELAHYFLFRYDRELGLDLRGFAPESLELLQAYSWPGNVRELQSAIKQAMLNASGHIVLPAFLPQAVHSGNTTPRATVLDIGPRLEGTQLDLSALIESLLRQGGRNIYAQVMEAVERVLLTRTLVKTGGHQTRASEVLGLNR